MVEDVMEWTVSRPENCKAVTGEAVLPLADGRPEELTRGALEATGRELLRLEGPGDPVRAVSTVSGEHGDPRSGAWCSVLGWPSWGSGRGPPGR